MAEENNKAPIKASTEDHSLLVDLGKYAVEQYIVPRTKDILHNTLSSIVDMMGESVQGSLNKAFHTEDRPTQRSYYQNRQQTNYQVYQRPSNAQKVNAYNPNRDAVGNRSSTQVKYIWVDDEESARKLISDLKEKIDIYGNAKVADLYESLEPKITPSFVDFKYGWVKGAEFGYRKEYTGEHRGQYFIDLPKPVDVTNA